MTDADKPRFKHAFNRLAVAVRLPADQADSATQRIFWDGLTPYSIASVEAAAATMANACQFFPKLTDWRTRAANLDQSAALAHSLPAHGHVWHATCEVCDDTGWQPYDCPGSIVCGRPRPHAAHPFAQPCDCRATNPIYQRRQTEAKQRAASRGEASRSRH